MIRGPLIIRGPLAVGSAPDSQRAPDDQRTPGAQRAPDIQRAPDSERGPDGQRGLMIRRALIIRGTLLFRRVTDDDWLSLRLLIVTGILFFWWAQMVKKSPVVQGNHYPKIKTLRIWSTIFWGDISSGAKTNANINDRHRQSKVGGGGGAELPKLPSWGELPHCPPPVPASLAETSRDMYWVAGFCGRRAAVARAPNTV